MLFLSTGINAQDSVLDSLTTELEGAKGERKIQLLIELSEFYSYKSYSKVVEYGEKALELARQNNDKYYMAHALYRIGEGLVLQKDFEKAFESYIESLKLFEEIEDPEGIFMANNGMGRAYKNNNNPIKAFEHFSQALKQAKLNGDNEQQAISLMNLGITTDDLGKSLEEIMSYLDSSYQLAKEIGDLRLMAFNLINMAHSYTERNLPGKAIEKLKEGIEIAEANNFEIVLIHLYGNLSLAYKKQGKYAEALQQMKTCLTYLPPDQQKIKLNIYSELPELYYLNNEYEQAYKNLLIHNELKDSLYNAERDQRFSALQTKYETEKKEQQIELLEKDNQIQTLWRNSFIGAFVFAFILAVGLYNRYRYKNKTSKELASLNKQLEGELKQAAEYIESLLPPKIDDRIKTDWKFIPSAHLGGDSFGYNFLDENHFAFYLIDVSGHGVGAALLSTSVLNILKSKSLPDTDFYNPAEVLNNLNKSFNMEEHDDKYFALWYGVIDLKSYELVCASAFHPPAIGVLNGDILQYGKKEMMIGVFQDYNFENAYYQLEKGESIFLFSDGCFELESGNADFEFEDFVQILHSATQDKNHTLEKIHSSLLSIKNSDKFDDDFSMLKICL